MFAKPKIKVRMRRKSWRGTVLSANYYYKGKEEKEVENGTQRD